MKFNKTILAAALLSVAVVGCASKDHRADVAPATAPEVVSSTTTTDDMGTVTDSDVMDDDSLSSGTTSSGAAVEPDDDLSTDDETWSDDVESGTTYDTEAKKHKKNKRGMTTTPSDSGTTREPMDDSLDSPSTIDSETGTSTSDGM